MLMQIALKIFVHLYGIPRLGLEYKTRQHTVRKNRVFNISFGQFNVEVGGYLGQHFLGPLTPKGHCG